MNWGPRTGRSCSAAERSRGSCCAARRTSRPVPGDCSRTPCTGWKPCTSRRKQDACARRPWPCGAPGDAILGRDCTEERGRQGDHLVLGKGGEGKGTNGQGVVCHLRQEDGRTGKRDRDHSPPAEPVPHHEKDGKDQEEDQER